MKVRGAMLDPDEARERSAEGFVPGSSAGPIALDQESVILRRRRWPARVAWVFAFLAVFGWFWWNFFSPEFGFLSSQRNGEDSLLELAGPAYLQEDTNLVKLVQNRLKNLGYQVGPGRRGRGAKDHEGPGTVSDEAGSSGDERSGSHH